MKERARGRRREIGAAAGEDVEGEEVAGFGEEESCQLADETETAVLGCAAVKRRIPDQLDGDT